MEFLTNFHFLRPLFLFFLLIPIGLWLKKTKKGVHSSSWADICDRHLLDFLLVNDSSVKRIPIKRYIYTGLVFAALAAAGPSWKKTEVPSFTLENPNMFVLSLAQDMQLTDVSPSRLDRAKFMISDLTESIKQGQFGLEVYSQEPYLVTPISDDIKLIKNIMPQIRPDIVPDNGDRLDRAIDLAVMRFKEAGYAQGNIILFTSDVGQRFDLALEKVKEAQQNNYTVNVVDTSFSGNEKLKLLAQNGNGVYLSVKETQLHKLINKIEQINEERVKLSENLRSSYLDYGYYLIFIPLLCLLPFFRRGMLVLMFCCLFSAQAHAGFWLNNNQEGLKLFKAEKYEEALDKFSLPEWRGVNLYKLDKKEEALKEFQKLKNSEGFYNQGVVLTKLCQYKDAKEAFAHALALNPDNTDAKYNQEILEDLLKKAESDPKLLDCNNQQQNNNQQQEKQDQNDDKQSQDDQQNSQQNQDQQTAEQENKDKQQNNGENQNSQENQQQTDNGQNSPENDKQSNEQQQQQNNAQQDSEQKNDENNPSDSDSQESNQQEEKKDSAASANNDSGDNTQSHNNKGNDDNGSEEQEEEQETATVNYKEGDQDEEYDEEAMALQRKYREIPEDTGGLLREFIKKEYMKDRYKNEN